MRGYWDANIHPELTGCPEGSIPQMIRDTNGALGTPGLYYPSCQSTGIVYAPPFSGAALLELVFPDDWSLLPPG